MVRKHRGRYAGGMDGHRMRSIENADLLFALHEPDFNADFGMRSIIVAFSPVSPEMSQKSTDEEPEMTLLLLIFILIGCVGALAQVIATV